MTRRARIVTGRRCGWPDRCTVKGAVHSLEPGGRRIWGYHDVQCQVPNPRPGPHLDGYPECGPAGGHDGGHDYVRRAAEGFLAPAAAEAREPAIEAEL